MLITFEGIEGSGKSTQIKLLYEYLKLKGHDVIQTREPGGTIFGERLRDIFLKQDANIFPLTELLVIMAMRAQLVEELIIPALNAGKTVLCDRFADASYVYQGYGRGIDLGVIENLNRLATKGIRPDLTILKLRLRSKKCGKYYGKKKVTKLGRNFFLATRPYDQTRK